MLGDYLPTKLGMDPGRAWSGPVSPATTAAICCSSSKTARRPGWSSPVIRPRRGTSGTGGAYSDKSPLVAAFLLQEDTEMAVWSTEGRVVVFHTAALTPKPPAPPRASTS